MNLSTIADVLALRSSQNPEDTAFVFLDERGEETRQVTYGNFSPEPVVLRRVWRNMRNRPESLLLCLPRLSFQSRCWVVCWPAR